MSQVWMWNTLLTIGHIVSIRFHFDHGPWWWMKRSARAENAKEKREEKESGKDIKSSYRFFVLKMLLVRTALSLLLALSWRVYQTVDAFRSRWKVWLHKWLDGFKIYLLYVIEWLRLREIRNLLDSLYFCVCVESFVSIGLIFYLTDIQQYKIAHHDRLSEINQRDWTQSEMLSWCHLTMTITW